MSFKNNKMIKINKVFFFFLRLEAQRIVLIVTHKISEFLGEITVNHWNCFSFDRKESPTEH